MKAKIAVISSLCYDATVAPAPPLTTKNIRTQLIEKVLSRVSDIIKPDILLIPGDLTLNGDLASHQAFQTKLSNLVSKGIKVYVIPGNQDAKDGSATKISTGIFAALYYTGLPNNNLSFKQDTASISYLAQPYNDLYILGIACQYDPATTQGSVLPDTLDWISNIQFEKKDLVLAMTHPTVTEDWEDEAKYAKFYIIKNHGEVESTLRSTGINIVLHGHVQDITRDEADIKNKNEFYDIGIGIGSGYYGIRVLDIQNNKMEIQTEKVTIADLGIPNPEEWIEQFRTATRDSFKVKFLHLLISDPFFLDPNDPMLNTYALAAADALSAHYQGGEQITDMPDTTGWDPRVVEALTKIYTDLVPADEEATIDHLVHP